MYKFDSGIKNKLISIKSEVVDDDWERFNKKNPSNESSFFRILTKNIYKIASILLVSSVLIYGATQQIINYDLRTKLLAVHNEIFNLKKSKIALQQKIENFEKIIEELNKVQKNNEPNLKSKQTKKIIKDRNHSAKEKEISPIALASPKKKTKVKFFRKVKMAFGKVFTSKKDASANDKSIKNNRIIDTLTTLTPMKDSIIKVIPVNDTLK